MPKRKCDRGVTGEEGYNEIAQIGVTLFQNVPLFTGWGWCSSWGEKIWTAHEKGGGGKILDASGRGEKLVTHLGGGEKF